MATNDRNSDDLTVGEHTLYLFKDGAVNLRSSREDNQHHRRIIRNIVVL